MTPLRIPESTPIGTTLFLLPLAVTTSGDAGNFGAVVELSVE